MMFNMRNLITDRLLNYTSQHTASNPASNSFPSTTEQLDFARKITDELRQMGLSDVSLDTNGYVTATIPSNIEKKSPVVGFISHLDTSPDFNGLDVHPIIHSNYSGFPIQLKNNVTLDPSEFPELKNYIGQDIITSDGTSLLGADNKAGIAEIITAAEFLMKNPDIPHGKIRICFTPDEEIGRGTEKFDIKNFGADFAFTVDGGEIGELEFENFNAALAKIRVDGKSVHPGSAKNRMINASLVALNLIEMLPPQERPEYTEKYEGFYHLTKFAGNVEKAELEYLIRDHDFSKFEQKKDYLKNIAGLLNLKYGNDLVSIDIRDQYFNMRDKIEPVMQIVRLAEKAILSAGISPVIKAIRGGTDGAKLSYHGLPCPNIFTGGHNFHGPYEFIPVGSMEKAVEVIINICRLVPEMED